MKPKPILLVCRNVTPRPIYVSKCDTRVLSPEGKDQVGGKREQLAHRREVSRSSTMSPNDPEHDDAEGCLTVISIKDMVKPKVAERIVPAQEKTERKTMNEEASTSKVKVTTPPTSGGKKDKGKGNGAREVYASSGRLPISKIPRYHKVPSWTQEFCDAVHAYWENLQEVTPNGPNRVDASEIALVLDAQTSSMTPSTKAPAE
uniref:Integrase core domain containing protein n=1 Tax=Solanum tuberosum TaxID=4113 RepID=M1DPW7_SOLTU